MKHRSLHTELHIYKVAAGTDEGKGHEAENPQKKVSNFFIFNF
jgi:hypothetical protein